MRRIGVQGTEEQTYDLDEINQSRRDNASLPLKLQNWYWHPEATGDWEEHANPDPVAPEVGQIWVSIRCKTVDEMKAAIEQQATMLYGGDAE